VIWTGRAINAKEMSVPSDRQIIHLQQIEYYNRAIFDIELSWEKT